MYKRYNFEHTIGSISEIKTARYLQDVCGMSVVRNVYIPSRTGNTEIDIIGLNERGIFVIENKSYGGDVYGSVRDDYWSVVYQSINPDYSGNTYNMKNPVFQNRYHVEELLFMLDRSGFKDISVSNFVIFDDKVKSLNVTDDKNYEVFTLKGFIDFYNDIEFKSSLDDFTVKLLYDIFSDLSEKYRELNIIKSINEGHRYENESINS